MKTTDKIKWRKWEDDPEFGDYLVAIRLKYKLWGKWRKILEPAHYDFNGWTFINDWNEGEEYEYVGMLNVDDIPFPTEIED